MTITKKDIEKYIRYVGVSDDLPDQYNVPPHMYDRLTKNYDYKLEVNQQIIKMIYSVTYYMLFVEPVIKFLLSDKIKKFLKDD